MDRTWTLNAQLLGLALGLIAARSLLATPGYKVTVIPLPAGGPDIFHPLGINNSGQNRELCVQRRLLD
jgi:hypothetical protein